MSDSSIRHTLAVLTAAAVVGCGDFGEARRSERWAPPPPARSVTAESTPLEAKLAAKAPGVRGDGTIVTAVPWFEGSLEQALAEATRTNKRVFVDVGAYWCPPCQRMDEEVFVDAEVAKWLDARAIAVHVDAEAGEGPELVERWHVQAYPTLLWLDASGAERGRLVDFVSATDLVAKLDAIENGRGVLEELERAVEAKPEDLGLRLDLAHQLALLARKDAANVHYDHVLAADPDDAKGLASKVLYDRAVFFTDKLDGRREDAIAELRELQRRFPKSSSAVRGHRHIGRLLHALGRSDEAIAELDAMIATDPTNVELRASYGWFSFRERCEPARGLEIVRGAAESVAASARAAGEPDEGLATSEAELRYLEGELLHLTGDDAAAAQAMALASALAPRSAFYRRQAARFAGPGVGVHP